MIQYEFFFLFLLINIFFHRFNVTLDDCPGGIAQLCRSLANLGVTIKDIMHERAWLRDIYSVEVIKQFDNITQLNEFLQK